MAPENDDPNDPHSAKLPPVNKETKGRIKIPTEGVSPGIKIFVIGLTFFTVVAFGVFVAMFVKKTFIKEPGVSWGSELLTTADKLKAQGLKPQAIEQYKKYLDTQKVDKKTRSGISFDIGKLYAELGQCDDAVVWFILATEQHNDARYSESETLAKQCRNQPSTKQ